MKMVTSATTPLVWRNVLLLIAAGKAAIAGAGLGLAALGVVDVAGFLGVKPVIEEITRNHALDVFAYGGGAIGVAWRIVSKAITR